MNLRDLCTFTICLRALMPLPVLYDVLFTQTHVRSAWTWTRRKQDWHRFFVQRCNSGRLCNSRCGGRVSSGVVSWCFRSHWICLTDHSHTRTTHTHRPPMSTDHSHTRPRTTHARARPGTTHARARHPCPRRRFQNCKLHNFRFIFYEFQIFDAVGRGGEKPHVFCFFSNSWTDHPCPNTRFSMFFLCFHAQTLFF